MSQQIIQIQSLKTPHSHHYHINSQNPSTLRGEKVQLRAVQNQISVLENRINLLKLHEQKQKQKVNQNKEKIKGLIEKKMQVNQIMKYKDRDNSQDIEKIKEKKIKNQQVRESHNKELNTILKACYLVKLDEARQLKNMTIAHEKKIQEIKQEIYNQKKNKQTKIKGMKEVSKQRYKNYWKKKVIEIFSSHQKLTSQLSNMRQEKLKYLKQLQQEQIKLLKKVNKIHSQTIQAKKQYNTALNIPIKQVVQMMGKNTNENKRYSTIQRSYQSTQSKNDSKILRSSVKKIPKTNLNEAKLKLILDQLKKVQ